MARIILLRHGESMGNAWKQAYKNDNTNFLSPIGVVQADYAGKIFKRLNMTFDAIYSSALLRARHTASTVLCAMDDWQREIVVDARLNEWSMKHETEEEHCTRVGSCVGDIMSRHTIGTVLIVSHYYTTQRIFDFLPLNRAIMPSHNGKTVPNAVPFMYDTESPNNIKLLDFNSSLGVQY